MRSRADSARVNRDVLPQLRSEVALVRNVELGLNRRPPAADLNHVVDNPGSSVAALACALFEYGCARIANRAQQVIDESTAAEEMRGVCGSGGCGSTPTGGTGCALALGCARGVG